ncbi:MAG: ABC transporter substrate-binding protein, partial [Polyangiales bacterium]
MGSFDDPEALRLGAIFVLHGPQAGINWQRARSASVAVQEINTAGGVPTGRGFRKLALLTCDTGDDVVLAGEHLIDDLGVAAIIGPNASQDVIALNNRLTIARGTPTISPTAMADSIADLADHDLSWLLAPTDVQRGPLLIDEIHALEAALRERDPERPLKLSVVYRDDVLGAGTRLALTELTWHDKPLSDPENLGAHVRLDAYPTDVEDYDSLLDAQLAFGPDVVVLVGTGEAVSGILAPWEARLHNQPVPTPTPKPHYLLTDASKTPELLAHARRLPDLIQRVHGIGVAPGRETLAIYQAFERAYQAEYPDDALDVGGLGASYDAVYALAYAAAAQRDGEPLSAGFAALSQGQRAVAVGPDTFIAAATELRAGGQLRALGTLAPLSWDVRGAPIAGSLEVWCLAPGEGD